MVRTIMIFTLAAVVLVACSTSSDFLVNISFKDLSGLEKDDRVLFENNAAGRVKSVRFNEDGSYTVQVEIDEGFIMAATEYTQFSVADDPERQGHKSVRIQLNRQGGTPLEDGSSVVGVSSDEDLAAKIQKELEAGLGFLMEKMEAFGRDMQSIPESREYKELKKSLEELAAEIERKEKHAREKVKRQWLPKIQRELDELRERLKQMGREDEIAPLDREVDRIRRI